jgi:release factor glutamine methyltransferase
MSQQDAFLWREMLAQVTEQLGDANEARWICEHASGCDREEFIAELNNGVTVTMASNVHKMVERRLGGEPLQYVMRRWAFRHLDVMVDERVLIPRPETEQVVDFALGLAREMQMRLSRQLQIVDMGTGSGVIGLAIASELKLGAANVLLTDASSEALDVARANLVGVGRAAAQVRIAQGSWYEALPSSLRNKVDLIVSNPPYIAEHDEEVAADVRKYEPHIAL